MHLVGDGAAQPAALLADAQASERLHQFERPAATGEAAVVDGALESLGVHEHWNNPVDKLYSRDLDIGEGIELRKVIIGDLDLDADVDLFDFELFARQWGKPCSETNLCPPPGLYKTAIVDLEDLEIHLHNWLRGK